MLKVAFFGSDLFSINCLKQILPLYRPARTGIIDQLDVITRNPKPSGRGLKQLRDAPIASFAQENALTLLRAEKKTDFTEIAKKTHYDLCIAVSYGKLIPVSFLSTLKHGGLNVHPSILPKYSGPAPLQRALLNNDPTTGVSVQTLHPSEFDKGDVLLRQEYTVQQGESLMSLTEKLSKVGGQLLKTILEQGLYDKSSPTYRVLSPELPFSYAAKVTSSERQIDWSIHSVHDIIRRENTLGPLYSFKKAVSRKKSGGANGGTTLKRVVFTNCQASPTPFTAQQMSLPNGTFLLNSSGDLDIKLRDGFVTPREVKTEGFGSESGAKFFRSLKKKFGTSEDTCFTNASK